MAGRTFDLEREVPRIGQRAELLASWYLRFNGCFPISGFIVHDAGVVKQPGGQLTEADILAVRLPHTEEAIKAPNGLVRVQADPDLDVRPGIADIVSDHHQWHPLICEAYKRLRGHKVREQNPTEVAHWLFPPVTEPH